MLKFRTSRSEPMLQPFHFNKDSKVQEQFAYDCDINNIVAGMTSPLPMREPISDEVKVLTPDAYEKALYTKAQAVGIFLQTKGGLYSPQILSNTEYNFSILIDCSTGWTSTPYFCWM